MDSFMKLVKYYGHDFWQTNDTMMPKLALIDGGPWHVISLILLYLYFVTYSGPRFMKNRKPYNLRIIMIIHNIILVILNGGGLIYALPFAQWGLVSLKCDKFDVNPNNYGNTVLLYVCYIYYITKYLDLLDTVYFVLRKKFSHITVLHVFHHAMMPFWSYVCFKFAPFTNVGFIPLINGIVHTFMYTYYALAAIGPQMQKYLWWKIYITRLQLIQFISTGLHAGYWLVNKDCKCPKFLLFIQVLHSVLFFYLFLNFYLSSYKEKVQKRSLLNNQSELIIEDEKNKKKSS